jgi:hypothetical protein
MPAGAPGRAEGSRVDDSAREQRAADQADKKGMGPQQSTDRTAAGAGCLRGLITDADLPAAELEWPGLRAFFIELPREERPPTFLELVWRFEAWRDKAVQPS